MRSIVRGMVVLALAVALFIGVPLLIGYIELNF